MGTLKWQIGVKLVLIETLWNVKIFAEAIEELKDLGINRNIVECKVKTQLFREDGQTVLIETLWNVKTMPKSWQMQQMSINRNIVECKAF